MQANDLNNEKDLIFRLSGGDEVAFETIYRLYSGRLLGNLVKMVKSETLATEILQDIFVKIWDKREQIDPEKSFRSWLFKVGENVVYDFFRKASRDKILREALIRNSVDQYFHVEEALLSKEKQQIFKNAIDALPPQRRLIFNLCRIEGKSYEEVAKQLGISTSTISDHIVKANRFIFQYFSDNDKMMIALLVLVAIS